MWYLVIDGQIVGWSDDLDHLTKEQFKLGGIIKGIAHTKGVKIRCGFDWDCDGDITDHSFMDWPHIELVL